MCAYEAHQTMVAQYIHEAHGAVLCVECMGVIVGLCVCHLYWIMTMVM